MRSLDVLFACVLALTVTDAVAKSKAAAAPTISRNGEVNMGLAQSYLETDNLADALDRAKKAVASDPGYGETHAVLGLVYLRVGDRANAALELDKALKLAPASGAILNAHGALLCDQGQFEQADLEFRQAMADPFFADPTQAFFNAGRCAQKAGKLPMAESYLRSALARANDDPRILFALAEVKLGLGQWLEARAFVQRCLAVAPSPDALDLAARIEDAAGDKAAAAKYRKQRVDMFPNAEPTGEGAHAP